MERPKVETFTSGDAGWPAAQREATLRKVARRLIPVMCVCYFLAYIDRTNIGIAALTMNDDLGISATAFGLGPGCSSPGTSCSRCRATW